MLRTHVARRAGHIALGEAAIRLAHLRNAEVGNERPAGPPLEQDVGRLDVAMHDAVLMRVGERPGHLLQHPHGLVGRQGPGAADPLGERLALDVPHDEERELAVLLDRMNRHDVRMGEPRGGPRLAEESRPPPRLGGLRRRQELHGHRAIQRQIPREIDHPHPAPAQLAHQGVPARESGLQRQERGRGGIGHCNPLGPDRVY